MRRRRRDSNPGTREKERGLRQATGGSLAESPNLNLWSKLFKSGTHCSNSWLKNGGIFLLIWAKRFSHYGDSGAAMKRGVACSPWRSQSWTTKFYGHVMATKLSYSGHPDLTPGQCLQRTLFGALHIMLHICLSNFFLIWEKRFLWVENAAQVGTSTCSGTKPMTPTESWEAQLSCDVKIFASLLT